MPKSTSREEIKSLWASYSRSSAYPHTFQPVCSCAVFKGARALSNAEVAWALKSYMEQRMQEVEGYQEPPLVHKTRVYVDRFSQGKNENSSARIRE